MTYHSDIRILGGLPVGIAWEYEPAEPDVGIMTGGVSDWHIETINGRKTKADFLYKRIDATPGERDRITDALLNDRAHWSHYDYND